MLQLKNNVVEMSAVPSRRGLDVKRAEASEMTAIPSRRGVKAKRADASVKHPAFKALVALNIIGACVAAYLFFNREESPAQLRAEQAQEQASPARAGNTSQVNRQVNPATTTPRVNTARLQPPPEVKAVPQQRVITAPVLEKPVAKDPAPTSDQNLRVKPLPEKQTQTATTRDGESRSSEITEKVNYTVAGPQVYFHNQPDESTRRNAFINRWNKAVLKPLDEKNGFVYIVYTNQWGQTSKGWMLKKQLKPIN